MSRENFRSNEPSPKGAALQETKGNYEIILPYYPFKHELTRKADSLYLIEANSEALAQYQEANTYFRTTENWEGVAYTNNMMAEIYTNKLYEYRLAKNLLDQTESLIKEKLGSDHPLISDTYLTYGSYLENNGTADQVLEYLKISLKIRSNYFGDRSIQVAEANYRLGQHYHYYSRELYEEAKEYYNRALIIFEELLPPNHTDLIKIYYSLGSLYRFTMDFQRASIYMDLAIYKYSLDSLKNLRRIALSEFVKGNILNDIKKYSFSVPYFESGSKKLTAALGPVNYWFIFPNWGLGVSYLENGYYDKAIFFLNQSLKICNLYSSDEDPTHDYPFILISKGDYFSKIQMKDSAYYYLFKALKIRNKFFAEDNKAISNSYAKIANMYDNFKNYDSALYFSQMALISLVPEFNSLDFSQNPELNFDENLPRLIPTLALKAKIFQNKSQISSDKIELLLMALDLYNQLDHLSDGVKNSDLAEDSKLILTSDFHQIYDNAINCASQIYQITNEEKYLRNALSFFEKNKYMLLFQNLELARKSNELKIPFEYRFKEDSLKMLQDEIAQKIDNNDPQAISKLSTDRLIIDNALKELKKEIELNYPNFYQIEYDSLRINLDQLKDYAEKNNALLIEYFAGDSNIYIIGISPEKVTIHEIKRTRELNRNIDDFLNSISKGQLSGNIQEFYNNFKNSAYFVYKILFFPVIDQHHLSKDANIIISPDGILAQVPFEALISDLPDSNYPDYTKLDYLIRSHDISYVYSFNLFLKDNIKEPEKRNDILAFSYSGIDALKNPEKRSQDVFELPGTSREVESIRKIVRGRNLFLEDEEATETQFKTKSQDYQILHLAVHGIGDYESSINSRLAFKNQQDSLNDGNLFIYEIYNIDLSQVKLAILSACETGIGKEFQGEGVFSVARGFASAGCPSIIMSLWKVDDMVSADIMANFYRNLKKGSKINEALRVSKLDYLNNADQLQAHPGNWAAFVPLGQMNSIYDRKINPVMIGIIALIIVIIPIIILIYKRSHKQID